MAIKVYNCTALTGGGVRALDAISQAVLVNGDRAITLEGGKLHVHAYNSSSTAAESSPGVIRPNDYASSGVWENQSSPFGDIGPTITATVPIEGDIRGGCITKTGATELTITPCSCKDSTGQVALYTGVNKTITAPTGSAWAANTIYHIYQVRVVAGSVIEFRAYATEAAVVSDAAINAYRWVGEWLTNGSSQLIEGIMVGGYMLRGKASECILSATITNSYATVDHSLQVTAGKVELIEYGARDSAGSAFIYATEDGTNLSFVVGSTATTVTDTDMDVFGYSPNQKASLKPFNAARKFMSSSGTLDLLVHQVKYRR